MAYLFLLKFYLFKNIIITYQLQYPLYNINLFHVYANGIHPHNLYKFLLKCDISLPWVNCCQYHAYKKLNNLILYSFQKKYFKNLLPRHQFIIGRLYKHLYRLFAMTRSQPTKHIIFRTFRIRFTSSAIIRIFH